MSFFNFLTGKKWIIYLFTALLFISCEVQDEFIEDPKNKIVEAPDADNKKTGEGNKNVSLNAKVKTEDPTPNLQENVNENIEVKIPKEITQKEISEIPELDLTVKAKLIPGDKISIELAGEDEMTREFTLSKSGSVYYPYVNKVIAIEKTVEELQEELSEKLRQYFVEPVVNVSVIEWAERRVFLYGVQNGPNTTLLLPTKGMTASQLLISAGVSSKEADLSRIYLTRYVGDEKKVYPIPLQQLLENYDLKRDIILRPNDLIIVKEAPKIHVQGNVKSPGSFPVQQNQQVNLWQILSLADGPTEEADLNNIKILREQEAGGYEIKIVSAADIKQGELVFLEPDDVVVIPSQNENVVTVYGQVERPGTVKLQGKDTRLSNVIANAGGLNQYASRYIRVFRYSDSGQTQKFSIDFNAISSGDSKQDMTMQSGDVVYCDYGFW